MGAGQMREWMDELLTAGLNDDRKQIKVGDPQDGDKMSARVSMHACWHGQNEWQWS